MWLQSAVVLLILGVGLVILLRRSFTVITVHGESMEPTLTAGDRLLCLTLWPHLWLQRGQIVTGLGNRLPPPAELRLDTKAFSGDGFALPDEFSGQNFVFEPVLFTKFVKRMIGLPGDTVRIPLSSLPSEVRPLLSHRYDQTGNVVWEVPASHCFLRGDGPASVDSVLLGSVPVSAITGVVLFKLAYRSDSNTNPAEEAPAS